MAKAVIVIATGFCALLSSAGCVGRSYSPDQSNPDVAAREPSDFTARTISNLLIEQGTPGASVAVLRGKDTVAMSGFGYSDLENRTPATSSTVYRIGSVTKQFTAAAILLLAERGQLSIDDELSRFFPDYPQPTGSATIRQLLNHTAGVKEFTEIGPEWDAKEWLALQHDDLVEVIRSQPGDFAPGGGWSYSNSGYYLLGVVIQKVSGQTYADFLSTEFFSPLRMSQTQYCNDLELINHRAGGYSVNSSGIRRARPVNMARPYAAGGLCSTVADLARWQVALATGKVISPVSFSGMTAPTPLPDGAQRAAGFGLAAATRWGRRVVYALGGIEGFSSAVFHYPEDELLTIILANNEAGEPQILRAEREIASKLLGAESR